MSKGVKVVLGTALGAVVVVVAAIAIVILTRDEAPEAVNLESTVARIEAAEATEGSAETPSTDASSDGSADVPSVDESPEEGVDTTSSTDDTPTPTTDESVDAGAVSTEETGAETAAADQTADQTADAVGGLAGVWTVQVAEDPGDLQGEPVVSFAGFRVDEVLGGGIGDFTAVGRTADVSGSIELTDNALVAATVEVTMSTLRTDNGSRDSQVRRALNTNDFPLAVFTLIEPVALPAGMAGGEAFSGSAVGDLTDQGGHQPGAVRPAGSARGRHHRGRRIQRGRLQRLRRDRPDCAHRRLGRGQRHHGVPAHLYPLRGDSPSRPQDGVALCPGTGVETRAAAVPVLAVVLRPGTRMRRQQRGRFEPELAVVPVQPPSVVVDEVVAGLAQQAQVVDVSGTAAGKPFDVVRFAPFGGGRAVDAAAVTGSQHEPLAGTGLPVGSSQPQRVALGAEDGRQDPSIGRQRGDLVRSHRQAVVIAQVPEFACHDVVVGDDQQRGLGAIVRALAGDQIGQGIGAALG